MLLQRKSLSFVAPSDVKYLSFMLLKVCKWTVLFYFTCQNYQNSLKRVLLRVHDITAALPMALYKIMFMVWYDTKQRGALAVLSAVAEFLVYVDYPVELETFVWFDLRLWTRIRERMWERSRRPRQLSHRVGGPPLIQLWSSTDGTESRWSGR